MMAGLSEHCSVYSTAVFEDCGQRDSTTDWLTKGRKGHDCPFLMATEHVPADPLDPLAVNLPNAQVFLGSRNLGVAGNSNRAIRHFLSGDWDHLCLCNDDLHVDGDFVRYYAKAHKDLGIGMFCFTDFTGDSYKYTVVPWRGYELKLMSRFTGIMISLTRELVEKIGGFDAAFGKFGEEHSDYTIRARLAGGINVDKQPMNCLDLKHPFLRHQEVETSVVGLPRKMADKEASEVMSECSHAYSYRHFYREPLLSLPKTAGGLYGRGIPVKPLLESGYKLVTALT